MLSEAPNGAVNTYFPVDWNNRHKDAAEKSVQALIEYLMAGQRTTQFGLPPLVRPIGVLEVARPDCCLLDKLKRITGHSFA